VARPQDRHLRIIKKSITVKPMAFRLPFLVAGHLLAVAGVVAASGPLSLERAVDVIAVSSNREPTWRVVLDLKQGGAATALHLPATGAEHHRGKGVASAASLIYSRATRSRANPGQVRMAGSARPCSRAAAKSIRRGWCRSRAARLSSKSKVVPQAGESQAPGISGC
jgi:hypothetical protein